MNEDDLLKLRFDYAWKWFDYHAKQRITMFYYFLIIIGILASAYVQLLDKKLFALARGLSIIGFFLSIGFYCLDLRNRQMLRWGEDVLKKLEEKDIFNGYTDGNNQLGFIHKEKIESDNIGKLRSLRNRIINHSFWLHNIELGFATVFLLLTIWSLYNFYGIYCS